ncbi:MAG: asparagine synthase (glutamine-hydrolyzing) [Actinomycetota bacterium]|nr:asparagine synthase (glutamine-hydrolyzing) [Actinomycetota bacterium]
MARRMAHRGPDGEGTWHDAVAGLAIRRLAIIDLHERSNQPLHFGPWHLVFNGEIYNYLELRDELRRLGHEFVTEGDGEVLLHAWAQWEDSALERFNGMFAFALWHDERRELVCACDPFGEKPLFWSQAGERLVFASDVRAVLQARPDLGRPHDEALGPYLGRGVMPPIDESFFGGIHRLPGAHILRFSAGVADVRRYWSPRRVDVPAGYGEAVEGLCELLTDSIRLRLRADVPVGTSLSGGLDSSAIVSLAGRIAGDHTRHAFTARFPGFERDEWRYADAVAHAAGVGEHHAVEPTAADLLLELDTLVRFQEEPFGSTSIYAQWQVMRAARDAGVIVLLDGQGGDELFAGYAGSNGWALRSEGPFSVARGLVSARDRGAVLRALGSEELPASVVRWYRRREVTPYAAADVGEAAVRAITPSMRGDGLSGPLSRELLRQSFHTTIPALLRYADRSSMAFSREVRLPYLDRRVAEYAYSLPPDFLYRDGVTKAVLREAVRGLVPDVVLARRDKVGYETPQARWLSEPASVARVAEVLLDSRARTRGLYDTRTIEADVRVGRWRDTDGIWRALNLELWLGAFEGAAPDDTTSVGVA